MKLILYGQLPSGKGQIRKTWANGKLIHYPQKRFTDWRKDALKQLDIQIDGPATRARLPLSDRLGMAVQYTPADKRTRDVSGLLDALFHLLGHAGIIEDDGLIRNVTWTEEPLNRQEPRVVLELRPL